MCHSEITASLIHAIIFVEEKVEVLKLLNRKSKTVKKWRSRAWSIDPNKTNLTIVVRKKKLSQQISPLTYQKWLLP